jgi:FkbH-like protein
MRSDQPTQRDRSSADDDSSFGERLRWQSVLFAPALQRQELLALHAPWPLSERRIRVHRNHAVELTLSVARPFLEYAGIAPEWIVGDYDDSLSFPALEPADLEVVWLDYTRFADRMEPAEVGRWLAGRVAALRAQTTSPILVLDWDGDRSGAPAFADSLAGVHIADRSELFGRLGDQYFDPERAGLMGTRMSAKGAVETARLLGSRWLPALLAPRCKAVVVDLDNTLYDGVLGEDGSESLTLTDGHGELQRQLARLRESGLFLGLLSRNEEADVEALFGARADFPLRSDDFDARSVSWELKSAGLRSIADSLRIDPAAILFVDDNPGELLEAAMGVPGLSWVHAGPGGEDTARVLEWFPGLWAFERTEADALRSADLRANDERDRALERSADDLGGYYRELGVALEIGQNLATQLPRVAELSTKTNQFNLALSRYTAGAVEALAADETYQISTARLEDRLTDSGVVAMAVARRRGDQLIVEELCISCRALGRRLEDLIITRMLVTGRVFEGAREVVFRVADGPRNGPARTWLERFAGTDSGTLSSEVTVAAERVGAASVNGDVKIGRADER